MSVDTAGVLVVIDEGDHGRAAVSEALADPRYDVVTAESGERALATILERDFAAVLLDMKLPDMEGVEVARVLPRTYATYRRLVRDAETTRPDVFVAVDFPDFNFRLAAAVRKLGVPVVYYISPQLWAWRRGRMKTMRRIADRVLVIFPFEEAIYRGYAIERLESLTDSRSKAWLIAALLFAVAHVPAWGWSFALAVDFPFGLLMAAAFAWRRDLLANALAHSLGLVVAMLQV
jgi:CheY-like chemotaxis protein